MMRREANSGGYIDPIVGILGSVCRAGTKPEYRKRFAQGKKGNDDLGARRDSADDLDAFLAVVLKRAKRFHEYLDVTLEGAAPISFFAFGGDCEETLHAAVILQNEKTNKWVTAWNRRGLPQAEGQPAFFGRKCVEASRNENASSSLIRESRSNRQHLADGLATRLNNSPGAAATAAFVVYR